MGLVEPTASSIKPDYGITNVTTQIGTSAYLPCKVRKKRFDVMVVVENLV